MTQPGTLASRLQNHHRIDQQSSPPPAGLLRYFRFEILTLGALVAALLTLFVGCRGDSPAPDSNASGTIVGTVELTIRPGNESPEKSFRVDCHTDSTVFSILVQAEKVGKITFDSSLFQGKAFIKSIDNIENQGANGQNWLFQVNGVMAKVGCSDFTVKPDDVIVWSLGDYSLD